MAFPHLLMNCVMAFSANCHDITLVMFSALRYRDDMVDFTRFGSKADFAERMIFYVFVSDLLPCPAVTLTAASALF